MGWLGSAIPRVTRYGCLSFEPLRGMHEAGEGFIQVGRDGFAARPHGTRHPTTIALLSPCTLTERTTGHTDSTL